MIVVVVSKESHYPEEEACDNDPNYENVKASSVLSVILGCQPIKADPDSWLLDWSFGVSSREEFIVDLIDHWHDIESCHLDQDVVQNIEIGRIC